MWHEFLSFCGSALGVSALVGAIVFLCFGFLGSSLSECLRYAGWAAVCGLGLCALGGVMITFTGGWKPEERQRG